MHMSAPKTALLCETPCRPMRSVNLRVARLLSCSTSLGVKVLGPFQCHPV